MKHSEKTIIEWQDAKNYTAKRGRAAARPQLSVGAFKGGAAIVYINKVAAERLQINTEGAAYLLFGHAGGKQTPRLFAKAGSTKGFKLSRKNAGSYQFTNQDFVKGLFLRFGLEGKRFYFDVLLPDEQGVCELVLQTKKGGA